MKDVNFEGGNGWSEVRGDGGAPLSDGVGRGQVSYSTK